MSDYATFLDKKSQLGGMAGFDPLWIPDFLFDFQRALVEWAIRKGRSAIFADCGLGKSPMALVWSANVMRHTNKPVLILTPLAVSYQFQREGEKFGIEVHRPGEQNGSARIEVANYQRLHQLDSTRYAGIVCDEASILKHFDGATRKAISRFMNKIPYRLLATATPAPNDWSELGTSSESLGEFTHSDMIDEFFQEMDWDEKREAMFGGHHSRRISLGAIDSMSGRWRLKGHAYLPFWRWVASWARACRKPSDLSPEFSDAEFSLPPLIERDFVESSGPPEGYLFTLPAISMRQELDERRRTIEARCARVAALLEDSASGVVWCHLNRESELLAKLIPGAVEVAGAHTDEEKEERIADFLSGRARVLVTKARIAGLGLNLQHCHHVVTFASHSFESYYQSIRRCWRYGQRHAVTADIVWTEGEVRIKERLRTKCQRADTLFSAIIQNMRQATTLSIDKTHTRLPAPEWLCSTLS